MKTVIMTFMVIGSCIGGYIPEIWGGSLFSLSSIFISGAGGFLGIWAGFKMAKKIGLS